MIFNILIKISFVIINFFQNSIQSFKNKYNPTLIYKLHNNNKFYNKNINIHKKKLLYNNNNINDYFNFIKKDIINSTVFQNNVNNKKNITNIKRDNSSEIDNNNIININNIYDFTNFLKHKYD